MATLGKQIQLVTYADGPVLVSGPAAHATRLVLRNTGSGDVLLGDANVDYTHSFSLVVGNGTGTEKLYWTLERGESLYARPYGGPNVLYVLEGE